MALFQWENHLEWQKIKLFGLKLHLLLLELLEAFCIGNLLAAKVERVQFNQFGIIQLYGAWQWAI